MDVITSARSTKLLSFPAFDVKANYDHPDRETCEFQLFSSRKLAVEVKKNGLEFLRIRNSQSKGCEISSIRRMKISDLGCVACPKQEKDHIALGLITGQVRILDYKTSDIAIRFPVEGIRNGVVFLDFNASDEYLSGVFENGHVRIYGMKTKTKLESVEFDGSVTVARFHPTKRFHLSAASYKGSVFIYDVQSRKKLFQSNDSHCSPCRDVCMSALAPDTMVTVGYDCIINIFDTRRKGSPQQIKYCHPLSTVAMSDCANFICTGNLKGDLVCYDMRNTKEILNSKRVFDGPISRVGFLPSSDEKTNDSNSLEMQSIFDAKSTTRVSVVTKDPATKPARDSFYDFLDIDSFKNRDRKIRMSSHRDSFDMNVPHRKYLDEPGNSPSSRSIFPESPREVSNVKNKSLSCEDLAQHVSPKYVTFKPAASIDDLFNTADKLPNIIPKRPLLSFDMSTVNEQPENSNTEVASRPTNVSKRESRKSSTASLAENEENDDETSIASNKAVLKEIKSLRKEMNQKFFKLESDINFQAEKNKWDILNHCSHFQNAVLDRFDEMREVMGYLLQTDTFVHQFIQLQEQNDRLRSELDSLKNISI